MTRISPPRRLFASTAPRPSLYPNVHHASLQEERDALDAGYRSAVEEAEERGTSSALTVFERDVAGSLPVICRSIEDLLALAKSDHRLYTTYYKLIEADVIVPSGSEWDLYRQLTDTAIFPGYRQDIRFAALSLDGVGLTNYGDYSIVLRDAMIAHRASVFEQNSVIWMRRLGFDRAADLPRGARALWDDRGRLAVAKHGRSITNDTPPSSFPRILLTQGATALRTFLSKSTFGVR